MNKNGRPVSEADKAEIWRRRRSGESLPTIAKALERNVASVFKCLSATGGIAPAPRVRSARHLTLTEREEISRGLAAGWSLASIARCIGRPSCTVSREIARNGGPASYRAGKAEERACTSAGRPKGRRLHWNTALMRVVTIRLKMDWAPQQIAAWLKAEYPHDSSMWVSHETIYRTLYVQARGELKKELISHLRKRHAIRQPKKLLALRPGSYAIPDLVSISERPPEAQDRAVPGHWEGDLLAGSNNSHIITLVERRSRYAILIKTEGKDTVSVVNALTEHVQRLPDGLMRTLTWDQGREMAGHASFTVATDVKVFFCDPSSPWQRGTNENTNGLLRQYFPKGTDVSKFRQTQLDYVSWLLNTRPRKTLSYKTPAATLMAALQ